MATFSDLFTSFRKKYTSLKKGVTIYKMYVGRWFKNNDNPVALLYKKISK